MKKYKVKKAGSIEWQEIDASSPQDAIQKLFMVNASLHKKRFGVWIFGDRHGQLYSVRRSGGR